MLGKYLPNKRKIVLCFPLVTACFLLQVVKKEQEKKVQEKQLINRDVFMHVLINHVNDHKGAGSCTALAEPCCWHPDTKCLS